MSRRQVVAAELTWTGERFERDVRVEVGANGRIERVGRGEGAGAPAGAPARPLPGRALLPGLVNAHSHAFQRGLRGRGESYPEGGGSFWTWRRAMYELVGELDEEGFRRLSLAAFREMRAAGVTAVGEFHYFRHLRPDPGAPAGGDHLLDRALLAAAAAAGVRLALIPVYYRTGGVGRPLEGPQLRFATPSPEAYWRSLEALAAALDPATQTLAAAAHSLRAATPGEIAELYREAGRRRLPFHVHVEEQRREIEEVVDAYGEPPLRLLLRHLEPGDDLTAVHCTHSAAADLEALAGRGGRVAICPLTEASLGDGIADLPRLLETGSPLCLGTDSNARISMLEEMRWLEYVQRLARERRGVVRSPDGEVAAALLGIATAGGAASLGLDCGRLEAGAWADFAVVDLGHPALTGCAAEGLAAALVFGASEETIVATAVGGAWTRHRLPADGREDAALD